MLWPGLGKHPPTEDLIMPIEPQLAVRYSTTALPSKFQRTKMVEAYYKAHRALPAVCISNTCITPLGMHQVNTNGNQEVCFCSKTLTSSSLVAQLVERPNLSQ